MTSSIDAENLAVGELFMTGLERCDIEATRNIYAVDSNGPRQLDSNWTNISVFIHDQPIAKERK